MPATVFLSLRDRTNNTDTGRQDRNHRIRLNIVIWMLTVLNVV